MSLPLFVGTEVRRQLADGELTGAEVLDGLTLIAEPMFSLSMLDGLNKTLKSAGYDENPLSSVMMSTILGYLGQGVPTILGQVARTVDADRRSTYVDKNSDTPAFLQRFVQSTMLAKNPIKSQKRMAYVDEWGRKDTETNALLRGLENFISPGYISTIRTTPVDEELQRLSGAVGSTDVLPSKVGKYFSVSGQRKDLTAQEYETYATVAGQTAYSTLADLILSEEYRRMTDEEKAWAVADVYTYAVQTAKKRIAPDYKQDNWIANLAGDPIDAISLRVYAKANPGTSAVESVVAQTWRATEEQRALLIGQYSPDKDFADPNRRGYRYTVTAEWADREEEIYAEEFGKAFDRLSRSTRYENATAQERSDMISELERNARTDTRKKLAREMHRSGVRSAKTE